MRMSAYVDVCVCGRLRAVAARWGVGTRQGGGGVGLQRIAAARQLEDLEIQYANVIPMLFFGVLLVAGGAAASFRLSLRLLARDWKSGELLVLVAALWPVVRDLARLREGRPHRILVELGERLYQRKPADMRELLVAVDRIDTEIEAQEQRRVELDERVTDIEEQPVAFAISARSPKSWHMSLTYGVSPHPSQAPEYSKSGSKNCEPLTSALTLVRSTSTL